jgi:hypothetical protein
MLEPQRASDVLISNSSRAKAKGALNSQLAWSDKAMLHACNIVALPPRREWPMDEMNV